MKRSWRPVLFICCVFALLLAPAVGTLWTHGSVLQSSDRASFPRLTIQGRLNRDYLAQAGSWFEAHLAGRSQMITTNSLLQEKILKTSATDQVVLGRDGWLYYAGDMNGYVGAAPLSDHALENIAHNLAVLQRYAEAQGARFVFTIAPDKSQLYPGQMPARYLKSPRPTDVERLVPYLEQEGVTFVDLTATLAAQQQTDGMAEPLYLLRDSHWNNRGALLASDALIAALGMPSWDQGALAESQNWITRADSIGDLELMLHPAWPQAEKQYYLSGINDGLGISGGRWRYTSNVKDVTGDLVTTSSEATATLLVYRDSFGNALLPYLAAEAGEATFSKLVPYNALQVSDLGVDFVIVERAERHIGYLAQQAPIMPAPQVELDTTGAVQGPKVSTCEQGRNGPLASFSGMIDPDLATRDSRVYVSLETDTGVEQTFEAFTTSPDARHDNGYQAYIPALKVASGVKMVKVFVLNQGRLYLACSTPLRP